MSTRGVCGILSAVFEHGHGVLGVCQAPNKLRLTPYTGSLLQM